MASAARELAPTFRSLPTGTTRKKPHGSLARPKLPIGDSVTICLPFTQAATLSLAVMKSVAALGFCASLKLKRKSCLPGVALVRALSLASHIHFGDDS